MQQSEGSPLSPPPPGGDVGPGGGGGEKEEEEEVRMAPGRSLLATELGLLSPSVALTSISNSHYEIVCLCGAY